MPNDKTKKKTSLRKREKEHRAKPENFSKLWLIFQTCNSWNSKFNQEVQFPINLILRDETWKKNQFKKITKVKKNNN